LRIVLAGGGTGGHVYPSLAVARALQRECAEQALPLDLLYIGVRGRADETIVPREGIAFRAIAAGQLRVASPLMFVRNALRLGWGVLQSLRILRAFRPDAVFATGGYASVPVGVAARLLRRPLVVYLPDVTPGWAVRVLSRIATRMTTTSDRALAALPRARTAITGYPVRDEFWKLDRATARARLQLPAGEPVVLVTGASLGAQRINEAVFGALSALLARAHVVHVTGLAGEAAARSRRDALAEPLRGRYHVYGFLDDMPAAMIAADLVVSRSGASVLGELPAAGVASVLIPGEYEGWSQAPNAEYLRERGAAVVLRNAELERLADTVVELLDDAPRRGRMAAAARELARPEAARDLARVLMREAAR
jgi:UDP-N-acetylglucosamine--N-acetylmuramyl-(pentapeptide) pyrophosphoryl-undecaprenol N-acetylglucosamine transferase